MPTIAYCRSCLDTTPERHGLPICRACYDALPAHRKARRGETVADWASRVGYDVETPATVMGRRGRGRSRRSAARA